MIKRIVSAKALTVLVLLVLAAAAVSHVVGQDTQPSTRGSRFRDTLTNRPILIRSWNQVQSAFGRGAGEAEAETPAQPPQRMQVQAEDRLQPIAPPTERWAANPRVDTRLRVPPTQPADSQSRLQISQPATTINNQFADPQAPQLQLSDRGTGAQQGPTWAAPSQPTAPPLQTPTQTLPTTNQGQLSLGEPTTLSTQTVAAPSTSSGRLTINEATTFNPPATAPTSQGRLTINEAATFNPPAAPQATGRITVSEIRSAIIENSDASPTIDTFNRTTPPVRTQVTAAPTRQPAQDIWAPRQGQLEVRLPNQVKSHLADQAPALELRYVGPKQVTIGETAKYVVRLTNRGEQTVDGVHVRATIPEAAELETATTQTGAIQRHTDELGERVVWVIESAAPRSQAEMIIEVLPKRGGQFDLAVDWTRLPVATTARVAVVQPQLEIQVQGAAQAWLGEAETLDVTVTNHGNGPAENVTVKAMFGETELAAKPVGRIEAGESQRYQLQVKPHEAAALSYAIIAVDDSARGVSTVHQFDVQARTPQLAMEVFGPPRTWLKDGCTLQVTLANTGTGAAEDVVVNVVNTNGPVASTEIGALAAGETRQVELVVPAASVGTNVYGIEANESTGQLARARHTVEVKQRTPQLVVEVSGPEKAWLGDPCTVQVQVSNIGTGTAEGVTLQAIGASGPLAAADVGTLAVGEIRQAELQVTPPAVGANAVVLEATDSTGNQATARHNINIEQRQAQLAIEVSGPEEMWLGDDCVLNVQIANSGTGAAKGVTIRATGSNGPVGATRIETLEIGETGQAELSIAPNAAGTHVLTIEATDADGQFASAQHNIIAKKRTPELAVEIAGPDQMWLGDNCTLQIKLTNNGTGAARDVPLLVLMPGAPSRATKLSEIGIGESKLMELDVTPSAGGEAEVRVVFGSGLPIATTATHRLQVDVRKPELAMSISGPSELQQGEQATLQMTIDNSGTGEASDVEVEVQIDEQQSRSVAVGTIAAGATKTLEIDIAPSRRGLTSIAATAAGKESQATAKHAIQVRAADLVVLADGPANRFASAAGTYTFTIRNQGNMTAEGVRLAVLLPAGAKAVATSEAVTVGRELQWNVGELAAGETRTYNIKCVLTAPGQQQFKVLARGGNVNATADVETVVKTVADLRLKVDEPAGPLPTGKKVAYQFELTNKGSVAARDVQIIVRLANGLQPSAASDQGQIAGNVITFPSISVLQSGESRQFTFDAMPAKQGSLAFRVEVISADPPATRASEGATFFYDAD